MVMVPLGGILQNRNKTASKVSEIPGQMFHPAMMGKSRLCGYIDLKVQL